MAAKNVVPHTVYVTRAQKKWLQEHSEFNLSGYIRPRLKKLIDTYTYLGDV